MSPMSMKTALALSLSLAPLLDAQAPKVGEPFPVQTFPVLGKPGDPAKLDSIASYRGKKLLLIQFASW